jgi:hypothetical protein
MKPTRIIIAAIALILITGLLSGCALVSKQEPAKKSVTAVNIELARKIAKDVTIKLSSERDGDKITVKIALDNPNGKPVSSVQSWLSYDPDVLEGESINVTDSAFEFTAPYDNTFDGVNGLVMIGRANTKPLTVKTINVAEVVFKVKTEGTTMIDFYDYQNDVSGHTSANMLLDGVPYNILLQPESPALIITNSKL